MNLFDKAAAWLPAMMQAAAGGTVSYRRGATTITLTAVVGQTVDRSNSEGPVRVEVGQRDYLITVGNLSFGTPMLGDRITDPSGKVWECQTPDTGDKAWRFTDATQTEYRIHTQQVA